MANTVTADTSNSEVLHHFQYLNPHQTANMAKRHMTVTPYRERKRQRQSGGSGGWTGSGGAGSGPGGGAGSGGTGSGVGNLGVSFSLDTQSFSQQPVTHTTTTTPIMSCSRSSDERFCDYLCEEFKAMSDEQTKVTLRRNIMNLVYNAQLELHATQLETRDTSSQAIILSDDSNSVSASAAVSHSSPQESD